MSNVCASMSMSLDGYVAGPNDSVGNGLGDSGMALHEWLFALPGFGGTSATQPTGDDPEADLLRSQFDRLGAAILGRRMFDHSSGPWTEPLSTGRWSTPSPWGAPSFVLTHYERPPVGDFTFVTGGIEEALRLARAAAGDKDISLSGGASVITQYLAAGLLDELTVSIVPVMLGGGVRLFGDTIPNGVKLRRTNALAADSGVTHLTYDVLR